MYCLWLAGGLDTELQRAHLDAMFGMSARSVPLPAVCSTDDIVTNDPLVVWLIDSAIGSVAFIALSII